MTRGQQVTITYGAYQFINGIPVGVDEAVGNHTLKLLRDANAAAAPTNAPVAVGGNTGQYKLTLTAAETNCAAGKLIGSSTTAGVFIVPVPFWPVRGLLNATGNSYTSGN